jgi:phosphate uptake regulator
MNRKVVELGKNCFVVSLPSKWVKSNEVKKGDEIALDEVEGRLVLAPADKKEREIKETELDLTETPKDLLRTEISFAYSGGYDKINVKYDKGQYEEIKGVVQDIILGFDITNRTDTTLVLDEVTGPSDDKKENLLRRLLRLIENDIFHMYGSIKRHNINKVTPSAAEAVKKLLGFYKKLQEAYFMKDVSALEQNSDKLRKYRYDSLNIEMMRSKGTDSLVLHYIAELCWLIDLADKMAISLYLF